MLFCFSTLSCNRSCLSVTEETVGQIKAFGLKQDTWVIQVLMLRNLKSQKCSSPAKNQRDASSISVTIKKGTACVQDEISLRMLQTKRESAQWPTVRYVY